jgi:hypothetical protein
MEVGRINANVGRLGLETRMMRESGANFKNEGDGKESIILYLSDADRDFDNMLNILNFHLNELVITTGDTTEYTNIKEVLPY